MKIIGSQLFCRETVESLAEKNIYLVCGLVKFDSSEKIEDGSVISLGSCNPCVLAIEDRHENTKGMALDQVMQEPIWRLR